MNALKAHLLTLLIAVNCCGQGIVTFQNSVLSPPALVYSDFVGGTKLLGLNYVAELYYGPDGAGASSLTPLPISISHFKYPATSTPGTWTGISNLSLPIGGCGSTITLDVRVWDITQAATYEDASAANGNLGRFGFSGPFTYIQLWDPTPYPPDTWMIRMPSFALVPEPCVFAVGGFGAVYLMLFRRRRAARL